MNLGSKTALSCLAMSSLIAHANTLHGSRAVCRRALASHRATHKNLLGQFEKSIQFCIEIHTRSWLTGPDFVAGATLLGKQR
jgi:hypothetical protein